MKNIVIKRLCVLTVILCMIFAQIPLSASAYDAFEYPKRFKAASSSSTDALAEYVDTASLRSYLFEAFKTCPENTDVSSFKIPLSLKNSLMDFIWREMPESFHVKGLGVTNKDNNIQNIIASYTYTSKEYNRMITACEEKAAVLLKDIIGNNSLSDVEKALFIHDRLAINCTYDLNAPNCYDAYGAIVLGRAVCDGYSKAYSYLLRKVGIESLNCSSQQLDHAWNLVLINGNYYHVDVTWDDPLCTNDSKTLEGSVIHNNFMLSNAGIKACKHNAEDFYAPAFDSTYDEYFWQCSDTEFQLLNGQIYYFDSRSGHLNVLNDDRVSGTVLYSVNDKWLAGKGRYWIGNFSRLGNDGKSLFFSTRDTIFKYNTELASAAAVYKPELEDYDYIYGFTYSNGYFIYDINNCPAKSAEHLKTVKYLYTDQNEKLQFSVLLPVTVTAKDISGEIISQTESESGSVTVDLFDNTEFIEITADGRIGKIYKVRDLKDTQAEINLDLIGDVNSDKRINNKDVTILFRYLSGYGIAIDAEAADVNGDGKINNKDVAYLFRALSDPKIKLVSHSVKMY